LVVVVGGKSINGKAASLWPSVPLIHYMIMRRRRRINEGMSADAWLGWAKSFSRSFFQTFICRLWKREKKRGRGQKPTDSTVQDVKSTTTQQLRRKKPLAPVPVDGWPPKSNVVVSPGVSLVVLYRHRERVTEFFSIQIPNIKTTLSTLSRPLLGLIARAALYPFALSMPPPPSIHPFRFIITESQRERPNNVPDRQVSFR
jgi:hypothetical protein